MAEQHIELMARFADGSARTVAVERDDAAGRREIDRVAFSFITRANVVRCEANRADRIAGYRSR